MLDHALSMAKKMLKFRGQGPMGFCHLQVQTLHARSPTKRCRAMAPADLRYATVLSSGVPLYLDRSLSVGPNAIGIDRDIRYHAESFGQLLSFLGNLLGPTVLPALHIFFEPPLTVTGRRRRELFGFNKDNLVVLLPPRIHLTPRIAQSIWSFRRRAPRMRVLTLRASPQLSREP